MPAPLSQLSVTGVVCVSLAVPSAVHTLLPSGTFTELPLAGAHPCST